MNEGKIRINIDIVAVICYYGLQEQEKSIIRKECL